MQPEPIQLRNPTVSSSHACRHLLHPCRQPPHSTPPLSTTFGPRQASLSTPCPNSTSLGCEAGSPPAVLNIFLGRRPSNRDPRRTPLFLHQPSFFEQPPCRLPFVTRQASVVELESTHGGPVTGPSAQQSFKCSQSLSSFATPPCLAATLVDTCYIPVDSHPSRLHPCRQPSVLDKPPSSTPCPTRQASVAKLDRPLLF